MVRISSRLAACSAAHTPPHVTVGVAHLRRSSLGTVATVVAHLQKQAAAAAAAVAEEGSKDAKSSPSGDPFVQRSVTQAATE